MTVSEIENLISLFLLFLHFACVNPLLPCSRLDEKNKNQQQQTMIIIELEHGMFQIQIQDSLFDR